MGPLVVSAGRKSRLFPIVSREWRWHVGDDLDAPPKPQRPPDHGADRCTQAAQHDGRCATTEAGTSPAEERSALRVGKQQGGQPVDLIIVIVLVVLLLAAVSPRAGWYGTSSALWDILSLIIFIAIIVFVLRLLGVLAF